MGDPRLEFRPLVGDDLPLLWEWLNREHVATWWRGEQSMEQVREKYLPRIAGADLARPFLALEDGDPSATSSTTSSSTATRTGGPTNRGPACWVSTSSSGSATG